MSEYDDKTYTVSFKTHAGYDASLIVVRGETVEELEGNVNALHNSLLETVVETEGMIRAINLANGPAPETQANAEDNVTPINGGNANAAQVKFCDHGKRQYREAKPGAGTWVGWFCPRPKGAADQCKPIFGDKE